MDNIETINTIFVETIPEMINDLHEISLDSLDFLEEGEEIPDIFPAIKWSNMEVNGHFYRIKVTVEIS